MATDEEYLDNLLKSLTGGDEPKTESTDGQDDAMGWEEIDDFTPVKADEQAATEMPVEAIAPEDTEMPAEAAAPQDTETSAEAAASEDTGMPAEAAAPQDAGMPAEAAASQDTEMSAEAAAPEEALMPEDREPAESGEKAKTEEAVPAGSMNMPFGMDEDSEGESFLDSLDMELDNVDDWKNDIEEVLAQSGGMESGTSDEAINLDAMDGNPAPGRSGDEGNIDDPELLQMFENLEGGDSDLDEINSLLNKANMNEDVDDDMLALLESAGENQNYEDSEEAFDIFAEGEMDDLSGPNISARTSTAAEGESGDNKKKKKKKPGFLAKILALLTKEAEEPEEEKPGKEPDVSDANAKLLKELSGGGKKAAGKEKKKAPKKDKKKKAKPAAKPKPPKPKKVKEKKPVAEEKPVKILNKKGLISIIALCATIIAGVLILSSFLPQYASKQEARNAFDNGDYETTYDLFYKKKLSKKEAELYNKAKTVLRMERKLKSYENNIAMDRELEAVDALFLGIKCYEGLREADTYDVRQEVDAIYQQICGILESNYGISQEEAISITKLDNVRYTKKIKALVGELAVPEETDAKTAETEDGGQDVQDALPEEEDLEDADTLPDILPEEEDIIE